MAVIVFLYLCVCVQRRLCLVGEQQAWLLSIWRSVAALRRDCHAMKTAADRYV